jgi:HK97 gp10 family phage protein
MSSSVKWHGDELLKQIREGTPEGLFAGGEILVEAAASRIHSNTHTLEKSGYVATEEKSTYKRSKVHNKEAKPPKGGAVVGFAAFYARYVEFGTKKKGAKPFLRPALDELKEKIGAEIVTTIGRKFK